jgi:hypothetical protein
MPSFQTSAAQRLSVTARGVVVPLLSQLNRHHWDDLGLAVLSAADGNTNAERYLLDRVEADLGVTAHDRLVADHGRDVVVGQHCAIDRPRRVRARTGKKAQDPGVFTKNDLIAIAAAERLIRNSSPAKQEDGREALQRIVDRREARILAARAATAEAEATALADLRDQSVQKRRDGRLRRVDGLELLRTSGALSDFGHRCAQRYGDLYKATQPRSTYRSCLAEQGAIVIDQRSDAEMATAEQAAKERALAARTMRRAIDRMVITATSAKALLILQQVAGEGATVASLSSSGPIRTVFRREVIAAIAVLEVVYSPRPVVAEPVGDAGSVAHVPNTPRRRVSETTILVDENNEFVREIVRLLPVHR